MGAGVGVGVCGGCGPPGVITNQLPTGWHGDKTPSR